MKSCNCNFSNDNTFALDMFRILRKDIKMMKRVIIIESALLLFFMTVSGFLFFNVYINADPNNPTFTTKPIKKVAVMTTTFKLKKKGSDVMDEECSV